MGPKAESRTVIDRDRFDVFLLDLDGVITDTAAVHAAAWKAMFDDYLRRRAARDDMPFRPFDLAADYARYVDGRPRADGVRAFLASRGISLPDGDPDDEPGRETVCGLGNLKNRRFREALAETGVAAFPAALRLMAAARDAGFGIAVISSSKNCAAVLEAAGLTDRFDARVDGLDLERLALAGKPAPDLFLEAARRLRADPGRAVVIEDALAGVEAGRAGDFGLVVGVDRGGRAKDLRAHGADVVVHDLDELEVGEAKLGQASETPGALDSLAEITERVRGKRIAVFLDYDGTLTPIAERPELAVLSATMRATLEALAKLCTVAIISGRSRKDVAAKVGLDTLFYAGSHGFDIAGPGGQALHHTAGRSYIPLIRKAESELRQRLAAIPGVLVEGKTYALAVHYRLVAPDDVPAIEAAVDDVVAKVPKLRKTGGKKVFELRPRMAWDKGKAVLWLLDALDLAGPDVVPFYLGDDITDDDAFAALHGRGIGIFVCETAAPTLADYRLRNPNDVSTFLRALVEILEDERR